MLCKKCGEEIYNNDKCPYCNQLQSQPLENKKNKKECRYCDKTFSLFSEVCKTCEGNPQNNNLNTNLHIENTYQIVCQNCGRMRNTNNRFCQYCGYDSRQKTNSFGCGTVIFICFICLLGIGLLFEELGNNVFNMFEENKGQTQQQSLSEEETIMFVERMYINIVEMEDVIRIFANSVEQYSHTNKLNDLIITYNETIQSKMDKIANDLIMKPFIVTAETKLIFENFTKNVLIATKKRQIDMIEGIKYNNEILIKNAYYASLDIHNSLDETEELLFLLAKDVGISEEEYYTIIAPYLLKKVEVLEKYDGLTKEELTEIRRQKDFAEQYMK